MGSLPPGEVKVENGRVLCPVAAQQKILRVLPHVWVVGHVDILQGRLPSQLSKVPQGDGRVWHVSETV